MNADGWDAASDPRALIAAAGGRVSVRKWLLLMAAATRDARRFHLLPTVSDAIVFAERTADGYTAERPAYQAGRMLENWAGTEVPLLLLGPTDATWAARVAAELCPRLDRIEADPARRAVWMREIVGNPFRWVRWEDEWLTHTVHAIAAPAYAAARFDTLPVLADALEDVGCDNDELLAHLRGPGPHARGCWALDVVLGKV